MRLSKWIVVVLAVAAVAMILSSCSGREQTITGPSDGALLAGNATSESNSNSSHGGRTRTAPSTPHLEFEGLVKSVGATELVVESRRGDATFVVNADTVIRKGQTAVAATDLKAGDRVHVRAAKINDALVALLVIVQNTEGEHEASEFEGTVKAISADSLTLSTRGGEVVLQLNAATTFTPAAPVVGDKVHVRAQKTNDVLVALIVNVQGKGDDDDGGEHHGGTVMTANGQVTATGSGQITVQSESHGSVVVKIDGNTIIKKQGTRIGAGDIKTGDFVNSRGTRIDEHSLLAEQIEVRGESGRK